MAPTAVTTTLKTLTNFHGRSKIITIGPKAIASSRHWFVCPVGSAPNHLERRKVTRKATELHPHRHQLPLVSLLIQGVPIVVVVD